VLTFFFFFVVCRAPNTEELEIGSSLEGGQALLFFLNLIYSQALLHLYLIPQTMSIYLVKPSKKLPMYMGRDFSIGVSLLGKGLLK
jgi:hypothetical protein